MRTGVRPFLRGISVGDRFAVDCDVFCRVPPADFFAFFFLLAIDLTPPTGASAVGALNVKIVLGEEEK